MSAIRPARTEEASALSALVRRAYAGWVPVIGREPAPMVDDYRARVDAGQAHVLEIDGVLAGLVVIEDNPDHLLLDNIAVDPGFQGRGLSKILLDFVVTTARARGHRRLVLYTNALMERNIALYTRHGWSPTRRVTEKGFSRVYMEKTID